MCSFCSAKNRASCTTADTLLKDKPLVCFASILGLGIVCNSMLIFPWTKKVTLWPQHIRKRARAPLASITSSPPEFGVGDPSANCPPQIFVI